VSSDSADLVTALARALKAQLIETHISWVLLADNLAYKIKKPVRLTFVDYSALQARRHFCEEEVRLNRRLAPTLYLGVCAITGTLDQPVIDGKGPVLEYAVRMRRFPSGALFSERLAAGTLQASHIDQLAQLLAGFHAQTARASADSGFAGAGRRRSSALKALAGVQAVASAAQYAALLDWLQARSAELAPLWSERLASGYVRECHGDLHLANLMVLDDSVAAFDGIEFDPALRWIDVLDDMAFVVMDLAAQGRRDLAFRFLNAWLDHSGDHAALPALRFAVVYRALVRAMVAQLGGGAGDAAARRYLETALAWTQPGAAQLFIMHGLPGSGKTFTAQGLLEHLGAIRLRSDVERKRLAGLGALEDSHSRGLNLYDTQVSARTYAQMFNLARVALRCGYPVIIDAAFLRRDERAAALALARELDVSLTIVVCEAPLEILQTRLRERRGDASEANEAVLAQLRAVAEPLDAQELALARTAEQVLRKTADA
jgi:aminoglycoside phosphotransferase family enzyme/predicted kinase